MLVLRFAAVGFILFLAIGTARAEYVNFESSHVHPIALTPSGGKLLVVNTPDALLEVFTVDANGALTPSASVPVGLEPVTVVARTDSEAWVANHLSDTVSIVDLGLGVTVRTLPVGDEPTDVAFTSGKAFVAVSNEDAVKVYDLGNLNAPPVVLQLFGSDTRALAVSRDGNTVYAVVQQSGNQTTVVNEGILFNNDSRLDTNRLAALGLNDMRCSSSPPPYPGLPAGIERNPALVDPPDGIPRVGLIVKWDGASEKWKDEAGQDWTPCLPYRLPDHDLFAIHATTLAVTQIDHLGTTLFDVSVNPATGKIYVPNTEARNFVRFEHALGVRGHMVDNRLTIVDPGVGSSVAFVDLNTHINRASDPGTNLAERLASISQPGMMAWKSDGTVGYLTAIGSRKLFVVNGACASGSCIFGPNRAAPSAVEVGEGPTGVAVLESKSRIYVLNRFSNSIAIVDSGSLTKTGEVPLHDPSSLTVRQGRRLLYDGIISSGHGDAACSSCHISGDKDGLAWDLGDPTGSLAPYSAANDNVRFVVPSGGQPVECPSSLCAAHEGFDPQKGPMTTQTLRAMLEPLHWRGDRPTMNEFNPAFVGLMGTKDIGPTNGKPAGLSAADMELYRQFALGIRFPPNPRRMVNDGLPNQNVPVPATSLGGNPARGETIFNTFQTDANQPCKSCHAHPFGTAGGTLGGVAPQQPTSPLAAALFNGDADLGPHSDVKIAHLRNMVEKPGVVFGPSGGPYPEAKTGFGLAHDGAVPNLLTFFSINVFTLSAANQGQDVRDISAFMLHFPTGTKPAVGQHLTLPPGTPPTGSTSEENLLATLISLGDLGSPSRHCELTASAITGGRIRSYRLTGGSFATDAAGAPAISITALREGAQGPISFLCATVGSGVRLGGDRDEDGFLNADDCAPGDADTWAPPGPVANLRVGGPSPALLSWDSQASLAGPSVRYDVVGGRLSDLLSSGLVASTACVAGDLADPAYADTRAPGAGDGYFYLVRARNACGSGGFGPGREPLESLVCP